MPPPASGRVHGGLAIANVSDNRAEYPSGTIPRYSKLDITFDVLHTTAGNLQLPFDPSPPVGIDPSRYPLHRGISVDLLLTPDNWITAYRHPAFAYQGYDDEIRPSWDGRNREWRYPTGNVVWKARFSPNRTGTWRYKIVARDSSATAESPVETVTVSPSASKGFIKVSRADSRYFEFDDGNPFLPIGLNEEPNFHDPMLGMKPLFRNYAANGVNLLRLWASGLYGSAWLEWVGGRNIYDGYLPRSGLEVSHDATRNTDQLALVLKYDGPNLSSAWYDACRFQFPDNPEPIKPDTRYRLAVKYRGAGISGPRSAATPGYGLVAKITSEWVPDCYEPGTGPIITGYGQDTSDWSTLEGTWYSGTPNFLPRIYLALENVTRGKVFVDSISLREDLGNDTFGPEILTEPSMQYDLYFPQASSYSLDKIVQLAEEAGIYLKLVLEDKNDTIYHKLRDDGAFVLGAEQDNLNGFYGLGRTMTKAKWLHQAWWRYVQARWGYSPAIHSWELTNEGDPGLVRHYEIADEMGKFLHCGVFGFGAGSGDASRCDYRHPNSHLVTTSFWTSFPATQFWKNPAYPNIDYADLHAYVSTSDVGLSATELSKMQWDSAYYHLGHSQAVRKWRLGKPTMRGEAGIDSIGKQVEQPDLARDTEGIWLHKLLWSTVDAGGMSEVYWWRDNIRHQPGPDGTPGLYEVFKVFSNFIKDIPLNNGNYEDVRAVVSDARLRVVGQRDAVHGKAHLWLDNMTDTWRTAVDHAGSVQISGTVTIMGMPDGTYAVTWFDTYNGTRSVGTVNSMEGRLTLAVPMLSTDIAVKLERD